MSRTGTTTATRRASLLRAAALAILVLAATAALALTACSSAKSTVTVALESQAGTGYEWTCIVSPEGAFTETSHETKPADDLAGGTLTDTFTFKAEQPGDASLTFMLERSWEDADAEAQLAQYAFKIDDAKNVTLDYKQGTYPDIPDPVIS